MRFSGKIFWVGLASWFCGAAIAEPWLPEIFVISEVDGVAYYQFNGDKLQIDSFRSLKNGASKLQFLQENGIAFGPAPSVRQAVADSVTRVERAMQQLLNAQNEVRVGAPVDESLPFGRIEAAKGRVQAALSDLEKAKATAERLNRRLSDSLSSRIARVRAEAPAQVAASNPNLASLAEASAGNALEYTRKQRLIDYKNGRGWGQIDHARADTRMAQQALDRAKAFANAAEKAGTPLSAQQRAALERAEQAVARRAETMLEFEAQAAELKPFRVAPSLAEEIPVARAALPRVAGAVERVAGAEAGVLGHVATAGATELEKKAATGAATRIATNMLALEGAEGVFIRKAASGLGTVAGAMLGILMDPGVAHGAEIKPSDCGMGIPKLTEAWSMLVHTNAAYVKNACSSEPWDKAKLRDFNRQAGEINAYVSRVMDIYGNRCMWVSREADAPLSTARDLIDARLSEQWNFFPQHVVVDDRHLDRPAHVPFRGADYRTKMMATGKCPYRDGKIPKEADEKMEQAGKRVLAMSETISKLMGDMLQTKLEAYRDYIQNQKWWKDMGGKPLKVDEDLAKAFYRRGELSSDPVTRYVGMGLQKWATAMREQRDRIKAVFGTETTPPPSKQVGYNLDLRPHRTGDAITVHADESELVRPNTEAL